MAATATRTRGQAQAAAAADRGLMSTTFRAIGTSVQLVTARGDVDVARRTVEHVLTALDHAVSRFRTDSELSWLVPGEWCPISPTFHRYLKAALDAAEWTGGLVDPTVGAALVSLGYDRTYSLVATDGPALSLGVRTVPGWTSVQLEEDRVLVPTGTRLDLGATAKALAADIAASRIAALGCSGLISLGGDIAVAGDAPDGGWPVLVADTADPDVLDGSGDVVTLVSGGLATSGTAARRWRRGGQQLHHIVDPRTATSTTGPWRTASVAASSCLLANTAATAAVVLGADAPGWLRHRGFTARLLHEDGTTVLTGDWPRPELP